MMNVSSNFITSDKTDIKLNNSVFNKFNLVKYLNKKTIHHN